MAELPNSQEPRKKSTGADLIIPVAGIAFTLYYFTTIWNAPWTAQVQFFIFHRCCFDGSQRCLFRDVCSSVAARVKPISSFAKMIQPVSAIPKRVALFALTLAYIFVIEWVGFLITTFVFLALAMLLLSEGKHKRLIISLSATLAIGGYLLFVVAFQRRFPDGPIEKWLKPFWYSTGIWQ